MSRPTAYLIHGYLGVGKTTYATRLARDRGAVRFSPDEWMTRLFGNDPPAETFWQHYDAVQALVDDLWPEFLCASRSVVLDFGFWRRAFRDRVRAAALACGAEVQLLHLTCPEPVARQRIAARNANLQGSLLVTPETYELLRPRFEPLAPDEPHQTVRTNSD